jgi:mannose-6-phosphate isomerase-like protein (cupin superfamily)
MPDSVWRAFDIKSLLEKREKSGAPYMEFLRVPALSCGIYTLDAGASDLQTPHDEDEVYYVIEGRARMLLDGKEQAVEAGSILYVAATAEHSFFEIEERMTLLVFFASGGSSDLK